MPAPLQGVDRDHDTIQLAGQAQIGLPLQVFPLCVHGSGRRQGFRTQHDHGEGGQTARQRAAYVHCHQEQQGVRGDEITGPIAQRGEELWPVLCGEIAAGNGKDDAQAKQERDSPPFTGGGVVPRRIEPCAFPGQHQPEQAATRKVAEGQEYAGGI